MGDMKDLKDKPPIAVLSLNNFGGIEILDVEYGINDYVVTAVNNAGKRCCCGRHKIDTTAAGRSYFRFGNNRYYLDEFLRTNI